MSFPFYFQFVSLHISGPLRLNTWGLLQLLTHLLADLLTESHNNDLRSKRTHKNCSIPHVCIPPPPQRWGGGGFRWDLITPNAPQCHFTRKLSAAVKTHWPTRGVTYAYDVTFTVVLMYISVALDSTETGECCVPGSVMSCQL